MIRGGKINPKAVQWAVEEEIYVPFSSKGESCRLERRAGRLVKGQAMTYEHSMWRMGYLIGKAQLLNIRLWLEVLSKSQLPLI